MNKELLKRTIQNLKDEYDRNHEYLEADEREQLLSDICELTKLLDTFSTEIEENYCPTTDKTFIMEWTMADGEMVAAECIGWYCGGPEPEATARYSRNGLKAAFWF